jgi:hypothetical protein
MFHVTRSSTRRALHLAHCWLLPDASEKRPLSDSLFDHLVGAGEQVRAFKVERLGGPEVDCEFKPARLNDRKIGGNVNDLALGVASLVQASSP